MHSPYLTFDPADIPSYLSRFGQEYNRASQECAATQAELAEARARLELLRADTFTRLRGTGTVKDGECRAAADPAVRKLADEVDQLEGVIRSQTYLLRALFMAHRGALAVLTRQPVPSDPLPEL